jgi:hypothetical protein
MKQSTKVVCHSRVIGNPGTLTTKGTKDTKFFVIPVKLVLAEAGSRNPGVALPGPHIPYQGVSKRGVFGSELIPALLLAREGNSRVELVVLDLPSFPSLSLY